MAQHADRFEQLYSLYENYNAHTNISAIRDREGIYSKHFEDSLRSLDLISKYQATKILDIGTGAGFPAIPLAIVQADLQITALDSVGKKTKFIDQVIHELQLSNLQTLTGRVEDFAHQAEHREQFECVVSRALAYLPSLAEYAVGFLKLGGYLLAYKQADEDELKAAKTAFEILSLDLIEQLNYEDKVIYVLRKMAKTDAKYPRRNGKVLKQPL